MWFHYSLEVPAGTLESAPVELPLKLTHGVIVFLGIPWQVGPNHLVFIRLLRRRHQIFPVNLAQAASGDGFLEGGLEHYELFDEPFSLVAVGYSPECIHDHNVTIMINVLPMLVAEPWRINLSDIPRRIPWPE